MAADTGTDVGRGLGADEVAARLERHGPNTFEGAAAVPAWRRLAAQFADPLIHLLLAAVLVSLAAWVADGAGGVPCSRRSGSRNSGLSSR